VVRWGLIPSWAKDPKVGARFINARRESVRDKPAFRAAFARRRCLVPADGYFEWQKVGGDKQPYFLVAQDRSPLAMAGLYEVWRAPDASPVWTCTVITTEAADELGHIHDRTPLVVPKDAWAAWLDPSVEDPGDGLLVPGTPGFLDAWPVSKDVGNVRNNGPHLVEPVPEQPQLL
jgi:putative SOS response-associated peptidase YedK